MKKLTQRQLPVCQNKLWPILNSKSPLITKYLGNKVIIREDWDNMKIITMENIIQLKIDQHEDVRQNLLNTGLRPIVEHTKDDSFWGDGGDDKGQNILGKILTNTRNRYYENM